MFPISEIANENEIEQEFLVDESLLRHIRKFIRTHSGGDFGGVCPPRERTQYKHAGKNMKHKGGNPPIDFFYVEEFVDLQIYVEEGDFENAIPIFFKLRRLIG